RIEDHRLDQIRTLPLWQHPGKARGGLSRGMGLGQDVRVPAHLREVQRTQCQRLPPPPSSRDWHTVYHSSEAFFSGSQREGPAAIPAAWSVNAPTAPMASFDPAWPVVVQVEGEVRYESPIADADGDAPHRHQHPALAGGHPLRLASAYFPETRLEIA